ncbi:HSP20-like chaperone [Neocallimastix lanati (nom. inval.)]|uniref:HSP20-like chaperone n=1 Tax=Neocallimastix californiae TaxID=1754190 RepID=A0A1Y2EVU6_9FUNG|nr:HSP20-like chaperone [Neocallimastix sp. JGI-2020a]ORY75256.1 HSP20-like chaperone [Neocallimastix californiae]|eukprot:ORY75256.1 HSP20-like chaperone [Neocallimastix californiae]
MSLYIYSHPIENSLFDIFNDDFFNYPLNRRDNFGFGHPCCHIHSRYGHRKNSYNCLEKQLSRAFHDNEFLKLVEFNPKINLSEDENNYYIHVDLLGMTKDQIKMEINENRILTISGERKSIYDNSQNKSEDNEMETEDINENNETKEKQETKENEETTESEIKNKKNEDDNNNERKYSIIESSYGKFSRLFNIPEDADLENIQAKMENGVLEVIINKIEPPKNQNRTIQIQ